MAKREKKALEKKNWVQNFTLIGKASLSDYTFRINEHSEKSDWIYNSINLQVDCGPKCGKVVCELMGGYGAGRDNKIYVHGKKEDNSDDFDNQYQIAWEDRFDEEYLKDIGRLCFYTVGIERDIKENVVYSHFLSPYDVIAYLKENLTDGTRVKVRGQIRYTVYEDNVQTRKEINSIYLANDEKDPEDIALFTQTVLLDKDSIEKEDKDKYVFPVKVRLLEKFKEYNGNDLTEGGKVKGGKFVPLNKTMEYEYDPDEKEKAKLVLDKFFKVSKDVTQMTVEGIFVEGGATKKMTYDDLHPEVKELVDAGIMELEDAIAASVESGGKERRMILKRPRVKLVGEEGNKIGRIDKIERLYTEDDFMLDYLMNHEEDEDINEDSPESEENETGTTMSDLDDVDAWMKNLV